MYDVALTVEACLRAGTRVDLAWVVQTHGFSSRERAEALAITPGGGRVGSLLSGALNDQLADQAARRTDPRIVDVTVSEVDAMVAALSCGGHARCLLMSAAELPEELWDMLRTREPVCLVTHLDGDAITGTVLFTRDTIDGAGEDVARMFARGVSDTLVSSDTVVTVLWPVPRLLIVGAGSIAESLVAAATLLGWHTQTVTEVTEATGVIAGMATLDKLVVISHDDELAGPALRAALAGEVGYIGALGSRRTQQARADWLAYRGITDLERIHGPAGLDLGASSPAEIAVSILAEALSVASGASGTSMRGRTEPIHRTEPQSA
jgi:xanthine dehydrogenase accessory factor